MNLETFIKNFNYVIQNSGMSSSEIAAAIGAKNSGYLYRRFNAQNLLVKNVFSVAELLDMPAKRFFDAECVRDVEIARIDRQIKELEKRRKELLSGK